MKERMVSWLVVICLASLVLQLAVVWLQAHIGWLVIASLTVLVLAGLRHLRWNRHW